MALNLVERRLVDQRALLGVAFETCAHHHLADSFLQFLHKVVINTRLDIDPVGADTGLPGIAVLGGHQPGHRGIEIGVIKDDERGIATELQAHFLDRAAGLAHEQFAHRCRAGERYLANHRVGGQLLTHLGRPAF